MFRKLSLSALAALCLSPAFGQVLTGEQARLRVKEADEVRIDPATQRPEYIHLRPAEYISEANFLSWLRQALEMPAGSEFRQLESTTDQLGYKHIRYQQYHMGLPVEGHMYLVHIRNGRVVSCNGEFAPLSGNRPVVVLDEKGALNKALQHVPAQKYMWEIAGEEKLLKEITGDPNATFRPKGELVYAPAKGNFQQDPYVPAYKFDIYANQPLERSHVFIDAANGNLLFKLDQIHTADSTGVAHTKYSKTRSIKTQHVNGSYRLQETGRGGGIKTLNLQNGTSHNAAVDFLDSDNIWNNVNPAQNEVATDAHWGAEMTFDYFMTNFGRNSFNNNGATMLSYVHYGSNYNNAFWDGLRMTYGDGNGSMFTPLTSIDIVGHEFAHGVTSNTARLVYRNESGALNESFSDIFGTAIEFRYQTDSCNYLIGEKISPSKTPMRSMQNPNAHGHPDTYFGSFWYTGTLDNGGVHMNSGVQNYWYYLLAEGGQGTNDIGNAFNVTAIGREKAENIAYRNLTVYLTSISNYLDAAFYAAKAAGDLYGECSQEFKSTQDAWYAVGVGGNSQVKADFLASATYTCTAPGIVTFTNKSFNGHSYFWEFGDGNTSTTMNPTHTYTQPGTYTVKLRIVGNPLCGSLTDSVVMTNHIVVASSGGPKQIACKPTSTAPQQGLGILKVSLHNMSNSSSDALEGYQDFSCTSNAILIPGNSYTLRLEAGPPPPQRFKAWIDYNNDGMFDPVDELVASSNAFINSVNMTINTPANPTMLTPLRMRIATDLATIGVNGPCDNVQRGQVEDYSVIFSNTGVVGLADELAAKHNQLLVYPNPASQTVQLAYTGNGRNPLVVTLTNMLGQEVYRETANASAEYKTSLNVSTFAAGIYLVTVRDGDRQTVKKLVLKAQ